MGFEVPFDMFSEVFALAVSDAMLSEKHGIKGQLADGVDVIVEMRDVGNGNVVIRMLEGRPCDRSALAGLADAGLVWGPRVFSFPETLKRNMERKALH